MVLHGGKSGLVAYEKKTGEIAWQLDRPYDCPNENWDSYTTPLVVDYKDQQIILVWGADHVTAHRASEGDLLWSCGGFNPGGQANWPSVASPVVAGDVLIITYGRGQYLTGIRLGGSGDVTETHRLWTREGVGAFVPTPAVQGGHVYVLGDRGQITCIDPTSGRTLWAASLPKHRSKYYSSPTVTGGILYAAREDGAVFAVRIDGEFEVLAENPMGEKIIASPVPVANRLLLRGEDSLFLVGSQ
jgi:outer membrane protein assembly factor BamB